MTPFNRSLSFRIASAIVVAALLTALAVGLSAWRIVTEAADTSLARELKAEADVVASTINPLTLPALNSGDEETRTYGRIKTKLETLALATHSKRITIIGQDQKVRVDSTGMLPIMSDAPRLALDRFEFSRALQGETAVSIPFVGDDGKRYLAAYAKLPEPTDEIFTDQPKQNYILAIEAPTPLLDAKTHVLSATLVAIALATTAAVVLSYFISRTVTAPLLALADDAAILATGNLQHQIRIPKNNDEIALLGHTIDNMRQALGTRDVERQMMLAGIAHEIRNPLGGMELFSGLLEESIDEIDPQIPVNMVQKRELLEQTQRVRRELKYLTQVVNDFLAFARDTPIHAESFHVGELVEEVASLCSKVGFAELQIQIPDAASTSPAGCVHGDRNKIKQSLINLVENAIRATPPDGEIFISVQFISVQMLDENNQSINPTMCKITVKDTGKGMSDEVLAQAFTPFFTTEEKGSGLGLPLVRKIVRDHGGDVILQSQLGKGTSAILTLPIHHTPTRKTDAADTKFMHVSSMTAFAAGQQHNKTNSKHDDHDGSQPQKQSNIRNTQSTQHHNDDESLGDDDEEMLLRDG